MGSNLACRDDGPVTPNQEQLKNWAGNLSYGTTNVYSPSSLSEVVEIVERSQNVRALGSQHSFNKIADSTYALLSTRNMKGLALDKEARTVTVGAGVRYGDICEMLDQNGFALHNLASLPHISIVGACQTATHGSGVGNKILADGVRSFELVKADGEVVEISRERDQELFEGALVGLGSFGIITSITLDLQPSYRMSQLVYQNLPMHSLRRDFDAIMSSGYSVSLFTDWADDSVNQVWIKSRANSDQSISGFQFYGATAADRDLHPIISQSAAACTEQMGVEGAWYDRLPHFKMGFTPSSGDELQVEYFVPMERGHDAMVAIGRLNEFITPHLFISEIRTIAADKFWMSPFYEKPCVSIHFTFKPEWDEVLRIRPIVEDVLGPYDLRPHWAKLFSFSPQVLQSRIKRLADFRSLVLDFDPDGKFRNQFVRQYIFS